MTLCSHPALPVLLVSIMHGVCMVLAQANDAPAHGRPFFMTEQERVRLREWIATQDWARADYARIQAEARKGDGRLAAFLFALDGDPAYAPIAQKWLLGLFGKDGSLIGRARQALNNPEFFRGGVPHLSDVFYDTDFSPYVGFDWVYEGLEPDARETIRGGIATYMRYKMRCMDRWTQTPNLVFKPTAIVALAGLAIQDQEAITWGFHRKPESGIGGYFPVLNNMLKDGGAWHESPTYPIVHTDLYCMAQVSRLRALYDGKDWWVAPAPRGGSPKGLMDYYLDTAYPIEHTGLGPGQIRVVTYGDGATCAGGDLFLANPAGPGIDMARALVAAYDVSGDARLAPFVAMIPGYKPALLDRRPLPATVAFPAAPSRIWPDYGLAILRAEESPAYWTSDAPVVFQIMSAAYGHDHADKFGIILHGAGRLLYPDYNAIQYENHDIGWSRNTIAHNTLMVDEGDTRSTPPSAVRHDFSPEVKYLATSASGVFEAVDQTRALLLTREYLLDVFQASSPTPRVYDYLLHSLGAPRPVDPAPFKPSDALDGRFWLVSDRQAMTTDASWALDFAIRDAPGSRQGKFGPEWYAHAANVRVTMAAGRGTLVTRGTTGVELEARLKRPFEKLGMLVARRAGVRQTVFVATHEPYTNAVTPSIIAVTTLAQSDRAILVRVDSANYTDYAAVSFGPQPGAPEHALVADGQAKTSVAFTDYGYLRVYPDGTLAGRGGWKGLRLPAVTSTLTLNGQPVQASLQDGCLAYGAIRPSAEPPPVSEAECPLTIQITPEVARLEPAGRRTLSFAVKNTLREKVSGAFAFELPDGITVEPPVPAFASLRPGKTARVEVTFRADAGARAGKAIVPCRLTFRARDAAPVTSAALPVTLAVGPVLQAVYRYPGTNIFQADAPRFTIRHDMLSGLCRYLADDDGNVRLDGDPLFTFSDGKRDLLFSGTTHAFVWPRESPARIMAHANDVCRYHVAFGADRITVSMNAEWTQFDPTYFTVPGRWSAPAGNPVWARVIAVDAGGREMDAKPGTAQKIAAAELAFPGAAWHLAFAFTPPQPMAFAGTGLRFPIGSLNGDSWSVGFCRPGKLDDWRKGAAPAGRGGDARFGREK